MFKIIYTGVYHIVSRCLSYFTGGLSYVWELFRYSVLMGSESPFTFTISFSHSYVFVFILLPY